MIIFLDHDTVLLGLDIDMLIMQCHESCGILPFLTLFVTKNGFWPLFTRAYDHLAWRPQTPSRPLSPRQQTPSHLL